MAILDRLTTFSNAVATPATGISDVIDLGSTAITRNIGGPDAIYFVVRATGLTDTGSDATLRAELVSDSTANLATSPTSHIDTGTMSFATLTGKGPLIAVALPFGDYERYLGVKYTVTAGPFLTGSVSAFLTRNPTFWRAMQANNPVVR